MGAVTIIPSPLAKRPIAPFSVMDLKDDVHIAIMAYQAWGLNTLVNPFKSRADTSVGHTRPLCTLASRMIKLRSVDITFFTSRQMYARVTKEISRNFEDGEENVKNRIRYNYYL